MPPKRPANPPPDPVAVRNDFVEVSGELLQMFEEENAKLVSSRKAAQEALAVPGTKTVPQKLRVRMASAISAIVLPFQVHLPSSELLLTAS